MTNSETEYLVEPRPYVWIAIPAGKVTLIEEYGDESYFGEKGDKKIFEVAAFEIAKYPVTVAQYGLFIQDEGYANPEYWAGLAERIQAPQDFPNFSRPDHPRVNVTWYEAMAYCRWLSAKTGKTLTLPTEQMWQRAAQGDYNPKYPWGAWAEKRCNYAKKHGGTTPVSRYEGKDKGDSPYGVVDMAGNVWEWCVTAYDTGDNDTATGVHRVVRGGSWNVDAERVRASYRRRFSPSESGSNFGFRVISLP